MVQHVGDIRWIYNMDFFYREIALNVTSADNLNYKIDRNKIPQLPRIEPSSEMLNFDSSFHSHGMRQKFSSEDDPFINKNINLI